jgi:mono/diheme cytochrome c family protein
MAQLMAQLGVSAGRTVPNTNGARQQRACTTASSVKAAVPVAARRAASLAATLVVAGGVMGAADAPAVWAEDLTQATFTRSCAGCHAGMNDIALLLPFLVAAGVNCFAL